jgi:hypothetical protein
LLLQPKTSSVGRTGQVTDSAGFLFNDITITNAILPVDGERLNAVSDDRDPGGSLESLAYVE